KDIEDGGQKLLNTSAKDTFKFRYTVESKADSKKRVIEAVFRYHPYDMDQETYPDLMNVFGKNEMRKKRHDYDKIEGQDERVPAHSNDKPNPLAGVIDLYWHGRLIPDNNSKLDVE